MFYQDLKKINLIDVTTLFLDTLSSVFSLCMYKIQNTKYNSKKKGEEVLTRKSWKGLGGLRQCTRRTPATQRANTGYISNT